MGCHTWSYIKVAVPEQIVKKMQSDFQERYNEYMNCSYQELLDRFNHRMDILYPSVPEEYRHLNISSDEYKEEVDEMREYLKENNALENILSGNFECFRCLLDFDDYLEFIDLKGIKGIPNKLGYQNDLRWFSGNFYVGTTVLHDFFRVDKYPEEFFTEPELLIKWLSKRKYVGFWKDGCQKNLGFCEELKTKIRNAFAEYPGLLIEFG